MLLSTLNIQHTNTPELPLAFVVWPVDPTAQEILALVEAKGEVGCSVKELKVELDGTLSLNHTIKTLRLAKYLRAFPSAFRIVGDLGASQRVYPAGVSAAPNSVGEGDAEEREGSKDSEQEQQAIQVAAVADGLQDGLLARDSELPSALSETMSRLESQLLRETIQRLEGELEGLRRELRSREDETLCQICLDNVRNVVLLPCTHALNCSVCCAELARCPTCDAVISGRLECRLH